jgi:hypothetical protein
MVSGDGSVALDTGIDESAGDGSALPGDDGEGPDAATDGAFEAQADSGSDAVTNDAIALPDVIDEAPAHCSTDQFECIPPIPTGWEGPFEVYKGTAPPTACSPNFFPSFQGGQDLDAGPASCGCTCGNASGVQCSPVTASFYVSTAGITGCTSVGHCTNVSLPSGQCVTDVNASSECSSLLGSTLFTVSASTADGGSCAPIPTTAVPPTGWATTTRACVSTVALAQVDCPSGSVCAPKPDAPYADSTLCIAASGDVPCPAANYTNRTVSYASVSDGRRCAACTCGPVTGSSCKGYVQVTPTPAAGGTSCSGNYVQYVLPQSCTGGIQQPGDFMATVAPQGGSCAASVPLPTGTATAAAPTTFCCQ